jgi:signal transduction histidine kinase
MKILIVDDYPDNLKLLRAMLESEGIEVLEACDGLQALGFMEHEPVDAIISDILMPRMDGFRFCREVRKNKRWRQLPFLFHTATYVSPEDERLCYDLGADCYLRKPVSSKTLMAALAEVTRKGPRLAVPHSELPSDFEVMKEYSERLVSKLEHKNQELEQARENLERANENLEMRVRNRTAALRAANEELESFASSVSHDLRAPLRHITGYINTILRNLADQLDETNLAHLHTVQDSARKMEQLINSILELSRVASSEIRRCPVNLSAAASEIGAELRKREPARVARLEITPDLTAHGDPFLLRIMLANLLDNAWKYSRYRPETRIEFGRIAGPNDDTYFVRDNGAGFNMAYVGKLFSPFRRLHSPAEFEGVGIGLATARRIIDRHKGKIWAASVENQGATFYFSLG